MAALQLVRLLLASCRDLGWFDGARKALDAECRDIVAQCDVYRRKFGSEAPTRAIAGKVSKPPNFFESCLMMIDVRWTAPIALAVIISARAPGHAYGEQQLNQRPFKDCAECPEMIVIPAGSVELGSEASKMADQRASPRRRVRIGSFAASTHEITFAEWDTCVSDGGCNDYLPDDHGWGRGDRPVIDVSWIDAQQYVQWLRRRTGANYRLLGEAEWEYAAKAGANSGYWWGEKASHEYANYGADKCCSGALSGRDQWIETAPVGSFPANPFGLFDMNGNVAEWVEDCAAGNYENIPLDGEPYIASLCPERIHRGGGWYNIAAHIRSDIRPGDVETSRTPNLGFRVAKTVHGWGV